MFVLVRCTKNFSYYKAKKKKKKIRQWNANTTAEPEYMHIRIQKRKMSFQLKDKYLFSLVNWKTNKKNKKQKINETFLTTSSRSLYCIFCV